MASNDISKPVKSLCIIDGFLLSNAFVSFDDNHVMFSGIVKIPETSESSESIKKLDDMLDSACKIMVYAPDGTQYENAVKITVCEEQSKGELFIEAIGEPVSIKEGTPIYVVCVDSKSVSDLLTQGEQYRVLGLGIDVVAVLCDVGYVIEFNSMRFRTIDTACKQKQEQEKS